MEEDQLEQQNDSLEEQDAASREDANEDASLSESAESDSASSREDGANGGETDDDKPDASESDEDDDDDAMVPLSKLKKVRNEAKNLRDRLKTAEARVAELESQSADAALVQERDGLKAQVEDLTRQLQTERLSVHVTKAATDNGAIEPAVVARLVDVAKVEWGEDGTPTNLDALIADLKTSFPKLSAAAHGTGNTGSRSDSRGQDEAQTPKSRLASAYKK